MHKSFLGGSVTGSGPNSSMYNFRYINVNSSMGSIGMQSPDQKRPLIHANNSRKQLTRTPAKIFNPAPNWSISTAPATAQHWQNNS